MSTLLIEGGQRLSGAVAVAGNKNSALPHLEALAGMGARQVEGAGYVLDASEGLRPSSIYLHEASVTGTETALLAAAAAPGTTEIRHAACEPHVVELCAFLERLGAGVSGA